MARMRSPNYPGIGLPDAIERIKKIHDRQHQAAEPREVVAEHMGYGSLNGAALKTLSALIKYGLLEESGKGELRVSSLAISILFPQSTKEKADAIREAGSAPPLFSEVNDRWSGKAPSDESLKAFLIRKNFAQSAIESVIQSYRETFDLVTRESRGYDSSDSEKPEEGDEDELEPNVNTNKGRNFTPPTPPPGGKGYEINFVGSAVRINGIIGSKSEAATVIQALTALQALLPGDGDEPRVSDEELRRERQEAERVLDLHDFPDS